MDLNVTSSIAALASPPGGSLRGIVRISGDDAYKVLNGWFEPDDSIAWSSPKFAASHLGRMRLVDKDGSSIDLPVQVLYWPTRRSYTGQPLIELHLPGSPCLLETVLGEVYRHGARPARPGEFTLRAFLAGKLDLLQAEAVLGVIDACDHVELQAALAQLAGGVSAQLGQLRQDLLELLADLEAGLDFVDEDIEFVSRQEVTERLQNARIFVETLVQQSLDRMQSRVRPKIVLAGLPNAGKSTLFNRLIGTDTALTSPERGTTRDFLIRTVEWDQLGFDLIDTAGWESDAGGIAAAAQDQRTGQLQQANLLVWCSSLELNETQAMIDIQLLEEARSRMSATIHVLTKVDLYQSIPARLVTETEEDAIVFDRPYLILVSAATGEGLPRLRAEIKKRLAVGEGQGTQWLGMTAARCRATLESIMQALNRAGEVAKSPQFGDEMIAVDVREALDQLGIILGIVYTDDILDRIFSKFCIGK